MGGIEYTSLRSNLLLVGVVNPSECGLLVFLRSRYHPQKRRPLTQFLCFVPLSLALFINPACWPDRLRTHQWTVYGWALRGMNPSSSGLRTKNIWPQEPFSFLPTRSPGFLHLPPPSNYPPSPSCLPPLWYPPPHPSPKPHSSGFFLVSSICVKFCHHCISCSSIRGGRWASIVRGGRALLHCHWACNNNNHLHSWEAIFFLFICVRFCHCRISCNNVITRRRGGGRGGCRMQQHYHCAYISNNHLHHFGGVKSFLFVCEVLPLLHLV